MTKLKSQKNQLASAIWEQVPFKLSALDVNVKTSVRNGAVL